MRRGGRMRGRGRNQPRHQQIQPLMSERIQDIDMELELLRQKREMIEQHQLMLENQKMYDRQRYRETDKRGYFGSPGPSGSARDYARYYEDPVQEEDYIPRTSSRKHPANLGWPRGSNPKKYKRGTVAPSFGSRQPKPSHTQPSPAPKPPTKLDNTSQNNEDCILRPDSVPSLKIKGRLEYAFGFILKQMRENFAEIPEYMALMNHNPYASMFKAALRERIREVMMNKVVAHGLDVVTIYRKKHRVETDTSFLKKVRNDINSRTANVLPLNDDVIAAPIDPADYIKNEMGKVFDAEFHEIIRKLEIINDPKLSDSEKEKKLAKELVEVTSIGDNENDTEEVKLWKREVHKKIRQRLPKMLIKNVPSILRLLRLDHVYINTWTAMMSKTNEGDEEGVHKLEVGIEAETAFAPVYRAKVRGLPRLPVKIRQFLEPFKPMWVRKNKMVRNVVYAQFRDKEGLEELLKQNGVNYGECLLKISSNYNTRKDHNAASNRKSKISKRTSQNNAFKALKSSNTKPEISSDLENQINDLETSIKHTENEVNINQAVINKTKPEMKEENDVIPSQVDNPDNVTTDDGCRETNGDADKINDKSDGTVQDVVQNDNTISDDKTAKQNSIGVEIGNEGTQEENGGAAVDTSSG